MLKKTQIKRKTFLKRTPGTLKKKPLKTPAQKKFAARKKKLTKERELWASFGLVRPQKPRYVGLAGILWCVASQAVRRQEFALYGGLCVDGCGQRVERWEDAHCGHFEGAGKAATRFLRENLGLQHPNCNLDQRNGRAVQYSYGQEIDRRYGAGKAAEIRARSNETFTITEPYLLEEIARYQAILEGVDNSLQS